MDDYYTGVAAWKGFSAGAAGDDDGGAGGFADLLGGGVMDVGAGGDLDNAFNAELAARQQRDAVLIMIDCSTAMMRPPETIVKLEAPPPAASASTAAAGGPGGAVTSAAGDDARVKAAIRPADPTAAVASPAPFATAVKFAMKLYQEKVMSAEKDLVGVVLYATRAKLNHLGFPHVFVFHDLDCPSAPRVQELERLSAVTSDAHLTAEFERLVGSLPSSPAKAIFSARGGTATAVSVSGPVGSPTSPFALSEALWAVQHLFSNIARRSSVAFRRVMVFTNNDDPCGVGPATTLQSSARGSLVGSHTDPRSAVAMPKAPTSRGGALEFERCVARVRDLVAAGVTLEVFPVGVRVLPTTLTPGATVTSSSGLLVGSSGSMSIVGDFFHPLPGGTTAVATGGSSAREGSPPTGTSSSVGVSATGTAAVATLSALPLFDQDSFWGRLLAWLRSGATNALGEAPYVGTVHDDDAQTLLQSVRMRAYPQRSTASLTLRVGTDVCAPGVSVSMFLPVVPCAPPRSVWVESATNTLLTTESRTLIRETGEEADRNDYRYETQLAGTTVTFAPEEVTALRQRFSAVPGLVVLGFWPKAKLQPKWIVGRSGFIHPAVATCGQKGVRFFSALHRSLVKGGKVALAELVARVGSAPRLVALIPAGTDGHSRAPGASAAVTASSCGFHVTPLCFADDVRSLRFPPPAVAVPVDDAQVALTKRLVKKMTVDYDPSAITNPALQRQYAVLSRMAMFEGSVLEDEEESLPAPPSDSAPPPPVKIGGDASSASPSRPAPSWLPPDVTLPDREGMAALEPMMKAFRETVFTEGYDARASLGTVSKAKPPPSAEEVDAIDVVALEASGKVASLTIPFLKAFLKKYGDDTSGLKAQLVERVVQRVRRMAAAEGGGGAATIGSAPSTAAPGAKRARDGDADDLLGFGGDAD